MNPFKNSTVKYFLLWLLFSPLAQSSTHFDCSFPISGGNESIRLFTLTAEAYACFRQTDHLDLNIFNGLGQTVPFQLVHPSTTTEITSYQKSLPVFRDPPPPAYKTKDQTRRFRMLTGVSPQNDSIYDWKNNHRFYSSIVLENDEENDALPFIKVYVKAGSDEPIAATVIVESSNDLQDWTLSSTPQNILFLPGTSRNINKNTIQTGSHGDKTYIRLAILSNREDFEQLILKVDGHYTRRSSTAPKLQWLQPINIKALENGQTWQYSIADLVPISKIRLTPKNEIVFYSGSIYTLPHPDPIVTKRTDSEQSIQPKAKLKTALKTALKTKMELRQNGAPNWSYARHFQQFYAYDTEGSATVEPLSFPAVQSREWRFNFDQPNELLFEQLPKIEMGWTPLQVAFIAQGQEPYKLFVGSNEPNDSQSVNSHLVNRKHENVELVQLMPQADIDQITLPSSPAKESRDWVKILLGTLLLAGVALMIFMALKLVNKMKTDQASE